ncbi:hypothetical protein ABZ816_08920 [Actinosynnema sp. NPDC047251]|uniref:Short-chain dehydrogenase/reductase n=1 Tax=Saccharothrix espanaensis (strain ATCC 51144 / DSM 44229 / JCM 9112 / NBRC 15066 / NRRL 15764) TaxID=1179773 RepID=K0K8R1_SACES|nr:hypothetical protein [Saccharothrix espanaensis]CCH33932.1 hypothetical protein BN6_66950 [Saccharothrix espanaensis DSM 44229]
MSGRTALVLGGTGMLQGCADDLLAQGWRVVLPSRRPPRAGMAARAALGGRGHVPQSRSESGAEVGPEAGLKWVHADWERPEELAERVREVLPAPADLLVAWVHLSYRVPVLRAVAPLLAPHAPVVEVHDSSGIASRHGVPDPILAGHPTQQVVLGIVKHGTGTRWLSHEEASVGVLEAVRRAVEGKPPSVHQVGDVDTWAVR